MHQVLKALMISLIGWELGAQQPIPIDELVRVRTIDGRLLTARVREIRNDTLTLFLGMTVERIPAERIVAVSRRLGPDRKKGMRSGLKTGGWIGGGLVVLAIVADLGGGGDCLDCLPATPFAVPAGLLITGLGGLVGALVVPPSIWAPEHPLIDHGRRGRIGLTLSFKH